MPAPRGREAIKCNAKYTFHTAMLVLSTFHTLCHSKFQVRD